MINLLHINEADTSSYAPPKHVIKPYPGDTGYALVKKHFGKAFGKKRIKKLDEYGEVDLGEITGMGRGDDMPGGEPGYKSGPLSKKQTMLSTDDIEDPDDTNKRKKKLKKLISLEDFEK